MHRVTRSPAWRYAVAVLSVATATLLTLLLWHVVEPMRFLLLTAAVMFAAWQGGWGAGLLAAALAVVLAAYFLLAPFGSLAVLPENLLRLLMFAGLAAGITALSASRRRANERLARQAEELRRSACERDELLRREHAAREEAERANRAKDDFLHTVAHELRTPLTSLLMWTGMLDAGRLDAEGARQATRAVAGSVGALSFLVNDLLDAARLGGGKFRLDVRKAFLRPVIEEAVEIVRLTADAREVCLRAHLPGDLVEIKCDPDRLQQVVWNLLTNAVKFTPPGGAVDVTLVRDDGAACVIVRDTGAGIGAGDLPRVFERFYQVGDGGARRGLGLGLAIARRLVELHGGTITAESAGAGRGATFTVRLPLDESKTDGDASERATSRVGANTQGR